MEILAYQYLIGILLIMIASILILNRRNTITGLFQKSIPAPWNLEFFLKRSNHNKLSNVPYLFLEQYVISTHHKINGRFDQAILHFNGQPVLDVLIERKYPVHILPRQVHREDMFQAGLYALALMDQGVSVNSAKLVIIYCLQKQAMMCVQKKKSIDCLKCRNSRIFIRHFSPSKVIKELRKLDEIWYGTRKPKANPSSIKCRICPFGKSKCKYSKA